MKINENNCEIANQLYYYKSVTLTVAANL